MVTRGTSTRGASRVGCLAALLLVILAGYVTVVYLGSEIDYRSYVSEAQRQAGLASEFTDEEIRAALQRRAAELGLPPVAQRVEIRRSPGRRITIAAQYPDTLTFLDRWTWVRPRRVRVDTDY